jgi:autotransporter-associated beta strand protein
MNSQRKHSLPTALALASAALLAATALSLAQTTNLITLTNSDATGTSSFNAAGNWNSGAAPVSGAPNFNAYFTTNFTLRTPADGNNYTFAGDSLELDPFSTNGATTGTGTLSIKGFGTITVNDLLLNGGTIANNGTGGSPDTAVLAGNVTLLANSSLDGGNSAATTLNIQAPISGTGGLTIRDYGSVVLSTNNTYTGTTTISTNGTLRMGATNALPNGPGVGNFAMNGNNQVPTWSQSLGAALDLNGFDTTINGLSSGTNVMIYNSAVGKTNTLTLGAGNANGQTYKGYIRDNLGTGGAVALTKVGTLVENMGGFAGGYTYSGDTTVNDGILAMGVSLVLPWGPGKGNLIINSPGELNMSGRSEVVNGLFGDGLIDNVATGNSTLHFGSNDVSSVFSGTIQSSSTGLMRLEKWGSGTTTLSGNNSFNGLVNVHAGVLRITQSTGLGNPASGKVITVSSSTGDAQLHLDGSGGDLTLDPALSFQTAGTNGAIVNEAGNNTINGTISLITGGSTRIRVDGGTLALNGALGILANATSRTLTLDGAANGTVNAAIADGSPSTNILSLTKSGAGTWTLAGTNTYTDVTLVSAGTLKLAATGSISNSSTINVQSGAVFDVSSVSGWALDASGGKALKGSGTVAGDAIINGKITPGDALINQPIGTLTFLNHLTLAGTTTMELNRTNAPANSDRISANTLTLGGVLTVTNIGDALQTGDTFTLFHGTLNGSFTATNLPSNVTWDTSLLGSQGIIKVLSATVQQPYLSKINVSGTNIIISGTNAVPGQTYNVLTSTNLASGQWIPISTNTFSSSVFSVTNPVNGNAPQSFYRMKIN